MTEDQLRNLARTYKHNPALEKLVLLRQKNRAEFDKLPMTERLSVGHYIVAKEAHAELAKLRAEGGDD